MKYNDSTVELNNSKISMDKFILDKIKDGQRQNKDEYTDIYSIDFSYGSIIFTKKYNEKSTHIICQ